MICKMKNKQTFFSILVNYPQTFVILCLFFVGCGKKVTLLPVASSQTDTPLSNPVVSSGYSNQLKIDFQKYEDGAVYTQPNAIQDLKNLKFWDSNPTLSIKTWDTKNDNKALRVKFPRDLYNGQSGVTAETYLADKNEYTLEYKVYFEPNFQFNRGNVDNIYGGGKLLGLCGGSRPSGGLGKQDGMSARIMFRRDPKQKGNYIELYHYWRNQTGKYGDQLFLQNVNSGVWYTLKIRVNLGTDTTDGKLQVWVDGKEKINKAIRYLAPQADWKMNGMLFHTFMGGNEPFWAPDADTHLMIDDIRVDDKQF
jgi:hypothetical protein